MISADTQHCFNDHTTLFGRYERQIDVGTTFDAWWVKA